MNQLDVRRGYANTPRGQIHYAQAGQGEPLLLLHATSRSSRCYRRMMPILGAHFHVVAPDFPGFGNSHPLDAVHGIEDLAACIIDFLDAMKLERVHLFGLHLGNKVGAALAAGWPHRVHDVVLAGQTHSLIVDRARRDQEISRLSRHHYPPSAGSGNGLELLQAWTAVNANAQAQWYTKPLLQGQTVRAEDVDDARTRLVDYLTGQPSLVDLYAKVHAFDMTGAFGRIQARTLVLELLTRDEMHLGAQGPAMVALMQNAQCAHLQEADNMVLESRADEVCDVLMRFLATAQPMKIAA